MKLTKKRCVQDYKSVGKTIGDLNTTVTLKINKNTLFEFDTICLDNKKSRSMSVETILERFVENWKKQNGTELFRKLHSVDTDILK